MKGKTLERLGIAGMVGGLAIVASSLLPYVIFSRPVLGANASRLNDIKKELAQSPRLRLEDFTGQRIDSLSQYVSGLVAERKRLEQMTGLQEEIERYNEDMSHQKRNSHVVYDLGCVIVLGSLFGLYKGIRKIRKEEKYEDAWEQAIAENSKRDTKEAQRYS